ncbi:MAG: SDR family oxidoreductase, partial [Flammeovirgaceae bacterium]|nr:SDR family oxidoreductase [Flammeovirgaceae bacterium]
KKIGTSENLAEVVEFLLSEKSQWMSGQVMAIDGGISTLRV